MNQTTQKIPSCMRNLSYTYYVVQYTNGDAKFYLGHGLKAVSSMKHAIHFSRKKEAKVWIGFMSNCGVTTNSEVATRLVKMQPNIRKMRGLSKNNSELLELIKI